MMGMLGAGERKKSEEGRNKMLSLYALHFCASEDVKQTAGILGFRVGRG